MYIISGLITIRIVTHHLSVSSFESWVNRYGEVVGLRSNDQNSCSENALTIDLPPTYEDLFQKNSVSVSSSPSPPAYRK
jgi:hypothetical protein